LKGRQGGGQGLPIPFYCSNEKRKNGDRRTGMTEGGRRAGGRSSPDRRGYTGRILWRSCTGLREQRGRNERKGEIHDQGGEEKGKGEKDEKEVFLTLGDVPFSNFPRK